MSKLDPHHDLSIRLDLQSQYAWHQVAAEYYANRRNFLEAAFHWHKADRAVEAAKLLINNYRVIVEDGQVQAFWDFLKEKFSRGNLDELTWANLKIASGRAALLVNRITIAVGEFREAQKVDDLYCKARAGYYRAKALEKVSVAEAEKFYDMAIATIQAATENHEVRFYDLLIQVYVDKAWLYIQENQNLAKAEINLHLAEKLLKEPANENRCLVFNGWAGLHRKRLDREHEEQARLDAWAMANQTPNDELMIMTAHNLGLFYIMRGQQIARGLTYVQQAYTRAHEINYREWIAKCRQTMGVAAYFLRQYDEAITHYEIARKTYTEIGNKNWEAWACHDLAEAYAVKKAYGTGHHYYSRAYQLVSEEVQAADLLGELKQLAARFPQLATFLTDEQTRILTEIDKTGEIQNKRCQLLLNVSRKTAERRLEELVELGLLEPNGKQGRAFGYRRKVTPEV